jgi:hypothetical protein
MTWRLRPGIGLARRDDDLLQLGGDPPLRAVLPDTRSVRSLLLELARGAPLDGLDAAAARVLDALVAAGLVVSADDETDRHRRRAAFSVHLDVPDGALPVLVRLLGEVGLRLSDDPATASAVLVWREGEVGRALLDRWMRSGTPHLLVRESPGATVLGPYVLPGATACLRCVDAHLGEHDPRHALVVEQLATTPPLRPADPDPALRALAAGWAVRDLTAAAEGGLPATWSATVSLAELPPRVTAYHRHLHCGCAWAEELVDRAAALLGRAV